MRCRFADGSRRIRAVYPVSFFAEADPASANRIVFARRYRLACVVVGGVADSIDDLKLAGWTWAAIGSNRNLKDSQDLAVLQNSQLASRKADHHVTRRTGTAQLRGVLGQS